jgi:hypothetical protein
MFAWNKNSTFPIPVSDMNRSQCGKPFFSNTRQNGEWTESITLQDEKELAMFGE